LKMIYRSHGKNADYLAKKDLEEYKSYTSNLKAESGNHGYYNGNNTHYNRNYNNNNNNNYHSNFNNGRWRK